MAKKGKPSCQKESKRLPNPKEIQSGAVCEGYNRSAPTFLFIYSLKSESLCENKDPPLIK